MPEEDKHFVYLPSITKGGNPGTEGRPETAPAIFVDLKRCIGCNACSLACKQENNVQIGELWNEVYGAESGDFPSVRVQVMPMFCHQCQKAPCKAKCDSLGYNAIVKRQDGILFVDAPRCVGCQECVPVCPYKAMFFNTQTNKAEKCHFCMHRIDAGLLPACVITCLAFTREYGDYNTLKESHPETKAMGDHVRVLYGHLGEEPEGESHGPTNGHPNPVPCHD